MNSALTGLTVNIYLLLFLSIVTFGPGKTTSVTFSRLCNIVVF